MSAFPQHQENVAWGPCARCAEVRPLVGHWGEAQERKLCARCDNRAFQALLDATGRVLVDARGRAFRLAP